MIANLRVFIITVLTFLLFIGGVFLELFAAITAYLALLMIDQGTFAALVSFSRDILNLFSNNLERFFPAAATQANATLLGEMSPKAILLLIVGLTIGALLRFMFWGVKCYVRKDVSIG